MLVAYNENAQQGGMNNGMMMGGMGMNNNMNNNNNANNNNNNNNNNNRSGNGSGSGSGGRHSEELLDITTGIERRVRSIDSRLTDFIDSGGFMGSSGSRSGGGRAYGGKDKITGAQILEAIKDMVTTNETLVKDKRSDEGEVDRLKERLAQMSKDSAEAMMKHSDAVRETLEANRSRLEMQTVCLDVSFVAVHPDNVLSWLWITCGSLCCTFASCNRSCKG